MTNKWFKVVKITATVLSIGSSILSAWVSSEDATREIKKSVIEAVAKQAAKKEG